MTEKPTALRPGATIGIFTPSAPAHVKFRAKYQHGLEVLRSRGFTVVEGDLTASQRHEGYRSGSPRERAAEFMDLYRRKDVDALMSTIGGMNSASLIPYLDFDEIRATPKIVCGYSDVTSLHLAILAFSGLRTFYGPALVPSFGEWPEILPETFASFHSAVTNPFPRELTPPDRWSRHLRDASTEEWRTLPREFQRNEGWRVLSHGVAEAPLVIANLNTLLAAAGTPYFPALEGTILFVEQMRAGLSQEERLFRQLERMGVLEVIRGLVVGKPEIYDPEGAPFDYDGLVQEIVGERPYPVVTGFDCSHTSPMLTLAEHTQIRIDARTSRARFTLLEPMVSSA